MRRYVSILAPCALVLSLAACSSSSSDSSSTVGSTQPTAPPDLVVATSFFPLTEIVQQVSKNTPVEIVQLTPPGVGAHDYELTAQQLDALSESDVVFYLSGGLQPSVEKAVAQLPASVTVVDLMKSVPTMESAQKDDADHEHHNHGDVDPHVWLDPTNMITMTQAVSETLGDLNSARSTTYNINTTSYVDELTALGKEMDASFVACVSRALVTSHDAFGYFAARAKLTTVPIAGIDPDNEPSAKQLEDIASRAKTARATHIFLEEQLPDNLTRTVAQVVGAKVLTISAIETISSADLADGATYISRMRDNITAISEGLTCR